MTTVFSAYLSSWLISMPFRSIAKMRRPDLPELSSWLTNLLQLSSGIVCCK